MSGQVVYHLCVNLFNRQYTGLLYKKVSVTIWCSNNISSMKCIHVHFWSSCSLRASLPAFSCVHAFFFLIRVVLSRVVMHAFKLLFFVVAFWVFFPSLILDLFVTVMSVCLTWKFCFCFVCFRPIPWSTNQFTLYTLVAGLLTVLKTILMCIFHVMKSCQISWAILQDGPPPPLLTVC